MTRSIVFISSFLFAMNHFSNNGNNHNDNNMMMIMIRNALHFIQQKLKWIQQRTRTTLEYWTTTITTSTTTTMNTKMNKTQKTMIDNGSAYPKNNNDNNDVIDEMIQSINLKIQQMKNDHPSLSTKERKMKRIQNKKRNSQAWIQQSLSNVNQTNHRIMSQMKQNNDKKSLSSSSLDNNNNDDDDSKTKIQRKKKLDEIWVQKTLNDTYDALKNAELQKKREDEERIKAKKWAESVARQSID